MKSATDYLWFNTKKHREFINITHRVEDFVGHSGIGEGFVLVSAMHITAGVYVNDAESGLIADIEEWLEKLAPYRQDYRHHATGETNGDAHLKSLLIHHERLSYPSATGIWTSVHGSRFTMQSLTARGGKELS